MSFARLVLAFWLGIGQPAFAQNAAADRATSEFILCAPEDRIAAVASRHGLTVVRPVDEHMHGIFLVRGPVTPQVTNAVLGDAVDPTGKQLIDEVRSDPDVEHFVLNGAAIITETQASARLSESTVAILDSLANPTLTSYFGNSVWSQYVSQPAMGVIRVPDAQQLATGNGVVVAVIDTGVDPNHPGLQGSLVPGYDFTRDLAGPASEWADLDESTVAILDSATTSILNPSMPVSLNESTVAILDSATAGALDPTRLPAAFGHGTMVAGLVHVVAPSARIMPLKAFKADGSADVFDIERAIYYAVDHGAKVINMSFSMTTSSAELTHAIDYASAHGVIALASAGNSSRSALVFPAAFRNVMGIGSTSLTDERSSFTNFGDHLVKFTAPGETLITLYPGRRYASVSGTSFSTALVAGGAGLLSQLEPTVDQRSASRYLDDGALKRADWELGDGRINLYESLRTHAPATTPPPPDTSAPTVTLTSPPAGGIVTGIFPLAVNASDNVGVVGVQFTLDGVNLGEATVAPFEMNWDSTTTSSGAHMLAAIARDAAGNQSATSVGITVTNDTTAPTVTVTNPAAGATVAGTITLGAAASDDVGVAGVQFTLDGVNLGTEQATAPYALSWNSVTVPNGAHVLAAVARDAAGNQRTTSVNVVVTNDTTAPTVTMTSPAAGATVTGTITLDVAASDDVGVVGVQFTLDGVNLGTEQTTAPFVLSWNSVTVPNGAHVLAAVARDAAGNQRTTSINVVVTNDTTAPTVTMTSPAAGATVTGTITLDVAASDDVGVVGVQFTLDGVNLGTEQTTAPFVLSWNSATVPNGVHELAAVARDAASNQRNASVSVTVANDTTAPTVTVTSPADGATITGMITFGASASDDVGVVGVQFTLDGVNLGAEHTVAPYALTWNSETVANGVHVLGAVARDAAGNQRNASVSVTVTNDTTAPIVAVASPAAGATVAGTITLDAAASDDVGVAGVQFTLDGVNLGAESTVAPYGLTWNSETVPNGAHVLGAVARDAAGNQQTAIVAVVVANGLP